MKRFVRLLLILVLLAALLPAGAAFAQTQTGVDCASVSAQLGAKYKDSTLNGAEYCIIYPHKKAWNGDLVVFAHGYVFDNPANPFQAPSIPWDQAIRGDLNLPAMVVDLGYAFAISSYHKDGLAVKEGVQDILDLVNHLMKTSPKPGRVFITGVSEGGLISALLLEKHPELFSGGFSTCGPIGDFKLEAKYWGDFRQAFDFLFPGILNVPTSTAIYIPPPLRQAWVTNDTINPFTGDPISTLKLAVLLALQANPTNTTALLLAAQAPIDPADQINSTAETVLGLLDYNLQATNEARRELANNPLLPEETLLTTNTGSPYFSDGFVQTIPVQPMLPDPAVLPEIAANYTTSGLLTRPLVVMHTDGDPIVPVWHTILYEGKVAAAGASSNLVVMRIPRYGHCNFTPQEAVTGFMTMIQMANLAP